MLGANHSVYEPMVHLIPHFLTISITTVVVPQLSESAQREPYASFITIIKYNIRLLVSTTSSSRYLN